MRKRRILFICNDNIGKKMAGPGIRVWELGKALQSLGHRVAILARYVEKDHAGNGFAFLGQTTLLNLLVWSHRSDCIIQTGRPLPILVSVLLRKRIFFDQYDPVVFEFLEHVPGSLPARLRRRLMLFLWKLRQRVILRFGSGFLVANDQQKDFLIGQMAVLGHAKKLNAVTVVPFGLSDKKPLRSRQVLRGNKVRDTDFLLVWGGGVWGWFDPFTLLEALAMIKKRRDDIKAYFPGINPPNPDAAAMTVAEDFLSRANQLGLLDSTVFINKSWTSYEERANYLLEADTGISLHRDTLETRFAFRTRILDYLWAGLPIITSQGDCWAQVVEREGLGIAVPPGDVDRAAAAIIRMAEDHTWRRECRARVESVAARYRWKEIAAAVSDVADRQSRPSERT